MLFNLREAGGSAELKICKSAFLSLNHHNFSNTELVDLHRIKFYGIFVKLSSIVQLKYQRAKRLKFPFYVFGCSKGIRNEPFFIQSEKMTNFQGLKSQHRNFDCFVLISVLHLDLNLGKNICLVVF